MASMDVAGWLAYTADFHSRPPMPDFALRALTGDDRRPAYHLIRSLGPVGAAAPDQLPPGPPPPPPYFQLVLPDAPAPAPAPVPCAAPVAQR